MSRTKNVELVLREILAKELRIKNPEDGDDLVVLDPDFPTEEVVKDVLEVFGYYRHRPSVDDWQRSFSDLVRVIERELETMPLARRNLL